MLTLEMALNLNNIGSLASCELRSTDDANQSGGYNIVFKFIEGHGGEEKALTDEYGNIITTYLDRAKDFARKSGFDVEEIKVIPAST